MRCLPTSILAGRSVCLPLCDSTAEALACAMLADCDATSRKSLTAAMMVDPALALWCAINSEATAPPTVDTLAKWLIEALPGCLIVDEPASGSPLDSTDGEGIPREFDAEELVDWVATSVQTAEQLATTAADDDASKFATNPAYVRGLLHNATCWAGEEHAEGLAAEFDVALDGKSTGQSFDSSPLATEQETRLTEHWTHTSPMADHVFSLAAKLKHAADVESHFADTLQQEKMQALYTLAAGAGHEINNPLGSIAGRAQLLVRDEADPGRRRTLAKINTQAFRAHEMISDMMLFARPPKPVRADVDVATLAAEVVEKLREDAAQRSTIIAFTPPSEPVHLFADRSQIAVALRAMCVNSLEALGSGGHIEVTVRAVKNNGENTIQADGHGSSVQIDVRDDGPGVDPKLHSQLFDPFYSGREAGRGLGFGLSKCWRIATNHGGDIRIDSEPGCGATFTMILPVDSEQPVDSEKVEAD